MSVQFKGIVSSDGYVTTASDDQLFTLPRTVYQLTIVAGTTALEVLLNDETNALIVPANASRTWGVFPVTHFTIDNDAGVDVAWEGLY